MILNICPKKTLNPQYIYIYIEDPQFLPSKKNGGSSIFSLNIEDVPSIFWKGNLQNIWRIYPQYMVKEQNR